jgi:hypothetical protein
MRVGPLPGSAGHDKIDRIRYLSARRQEILAESARLEEKVRRIDEQLKKLAKPRKRSSP